MKVYLETLVGSVVLLSASLWRQRGFQTFVICNLIANREGIYFLHLTQHDQLNLHTTYMHFKSCLLALGCVSTTHV